MKKAMTVLLVLFAIIYCKAQTVTPVLINGVFNTYKETIFDGDNIQNRNLASAYFRSTPEAVVSPSTFVNVGSVKLNDKSLKFNQDNFYGSKIKKNNSDPDDDPDEFCNATTIDSMHWKIKGEGSIPAMNFIYAAPFPVFQNAPTLPENFKKSDTMFISLNDVSDCDSIIVKIWDSFSNGVNRKYLHFSVAYDAIPYLGGNKFFYITPQYFSQLSEGSGAYISIEAVNREYQTVSGKKYLFNTVTAITRPIINIIN